jgi:hypothetical protein
MVLEGGRQVAWGPVDLQVQICHELCNLNFFVSKGMRDNIGRGKKKEDLIFL